MNCPFPAIRSRDCPLSPKGSASQYDSGSNPVSGRIIVSGTGRRDASSGETVTAGEGVGSGAVGSPDVAGNVSADGGRAGVPDAACSPQAARSRRASISGIIRFTARTSLLQMGKAYAFPILSQVAYD